MKRHRVDYRFTFRGDEDECETLWFRWAWMAKLSAWLYEVQNDFGSVYTIRQADYKLEDK